MYKPRNQEFGIVRPGIILLLICSMIDSLIGVMGVLKCSFDHIPNVWLITVSICDIIGGVFSSLGYVIILDKNDINDKKIGKMMQLVHINKIITTVWTPWLMVNRDLLPESLHLLLKIHFSKLIIFIIMMTIIVLCLIRLKHKIKNLSDESDYSYMSSDVRGSESGNEEEF